MPYRRCVGCGRTAAKSELVRLALDRADPAATAIVLDGSGRMPGRGAYLCAEPEHGGPAAECLALAIRRNGPQRTLRARAGIDPKLVESVSR